MTILNLNNELNFELPFEDGAYSEYIRTIELTDSERDVVLSHMNGESQAELEDLGLEQSHPELFTKLKDIYDQMAREAEEKQWLWIGFRDGAFEYDVDEVIAYCETNCGFVFEADPEDFEDDEEYEDAKTEAFSEWLEDYLVSLDDDEFKEFMYKHLNAHVELDEQDFGMSRLLEDAKPLTEEEAQAIEARYFELVARLKELGCPQEDLNELIGRSVYDYICEYEYSWEDWELFIRSQFEDFYNTFGPSSMNYMPNQERLKDAIS